MMGYTICLHDVYSIYIHGSSIIFIFTGSALVFIVYPEVLSKLPGAQFWCFIFFLMLVTLGLDSQVRNSTLVNLLLHPCLCAH